MVYVKMVNIVTLMASLGIIKKKVYAIRKLKCMDKSLKKLGRSVFKFAGVTSIYWKIFSKPLKRYCDYFISLALFRMI